MLSLPRIDRNDPNEIRADDHDRDCVVASRNGILEWFRDAVQFSIRNAHAPNEVFDIEDVFLVRFGGQND